MDASTFKLHHPEFKETDPQLIVAKLQAAAVEMGGPDVFVWGAFAGPGQNPTTADIAQGYLAADLLITSPFGTELRQAEGAESPSKYRLQFDRLMIAVGGGFAVAGVVV